MIQMQNDSCKAPDIQQQYSIKVTLHFVVRQWSPNWIDVFSNYQPCYWPRLAQIRNQIVSTDGMVDSMSGWFFVTWPKEQIESAHWNSAQDTRCSVSFFQILVGAQQVEFRVIVGINNFFNQFIWHMTNNSWFITMC